MSRHDITPSFMILREGDRLRVYTAHQKPILMVQGQVTKDTAAALRGLADEIEEAAA